MARSTIHCGRHRDTLDALLSMTGPYGGDICKGRSLRPPAQLPVNSAVKTERQWKEVSIAFSFTFRHNAGHRN